MQPNTELVKLLAPQYSQELALQHRSSHNARSNGRMGDGSAEVTVPPCPCLVSVSVAVALSELLRDAGTCN